MHNDLQFSNYVTKFNKKCHIMHNNSNFTYYKLFTLHFVSFYLYFITKIVSFYSYFVTKNKYFI